MSLTDFLAYGDLAADLGGALGSIVLGGVNQFQSNKWNQNNFDLQKEHLQYQKDLQQTIFDREDTAIQRRAADLEAAGLSKTLAAGSAAGAGSIVSTTAAQRGYTPYDSSTMKQLQNIEMVNAVKGSIANLKKIEADAAKAQADSYRSSLLNRETEWNLGIAQKAGVMTTDNSQLAEISKILSGIFNFDIADLGKNAMEALGTIFQTIFAPMNEVRDVVTGNTHKQDASPTAQAFIDASNILNHSDDDVVLYSNQDKVTLPSGTRRHNYGSTGGSSGYNYKAVYVK